MNSLILISINANGTEDPILDLSIKKGYLVNDLYKDAHNFNKELIETGQTLYVCPGVKVPRHKLKALNLSTTIKPSKSNDIVLPEVEWSDCKHYNSHKIYPADGDSMLKFVRDIDPYSCAEVGKEQRALKRIIHWVKAYCDVPNTVFAFAEKTYSSRFWSDEACGLKLNTTMRDTLQAVIKPNVMDLSSWNYSRWRRIENLEKKHLQFIEPLTSDIFDCGKQLYSEESLLKISNKDKLVIDKSNFKDLEAYGESGDQENIVLLMELMSNCDFEKSAHFLYALIHNYRKSMTKTYGIDHISFKSLMAYLELSKQDLKHRHSIYTLIQDKLTKKDLWTGTVAQELAWAIGD
tara:strand:+ start:3764 stop:4810 length:1047 start_codon:yes stop_codon:yes gene_type:complete